MQRVTLHALRDAFPQEPPEACVRRRTAGSSQQERLFPVAPQVVTMLGCKANASTLYDSRTAALGVEAEATYTGFPQKTCLKGSLCVKSQYMRKANTCVTLWIRGNPTGAIAHSRAHVPNSHGSAHPHLRPATIRTTPLGVQVRDGAPSRGRGRRPSVWERPAQAQGRAVPSRRRDVLRAPDGRPWPRASSGWGRSLVAEEGLGEQGLGPDAIPLKESTASVV